MAKSKNNVLKSLGQIFDPRKSPFLYFLAFFISIPAIVYGVVGTGVLDVGRAADIGSWIRITAPVEGQTFRKGETVAINVQGFTEQVADLQIGVNGIPVNCAGDLVGGVSGSFSKACTWQANSTGVMIAKARIVPSGDGVTAVTETQVSFSVIADALSYIWANPVNGQGVGGAVSLAWYAGGLEDQEALSATRYNIYLDQASTTGGDVTAGTLIASGNLGTSGVCTWVDYGSVWRCTHPTSWSTQGVSNGTHSLTGVISKTEIGTGPSAQSTILITVSNADNSPVCNNITLSSDVIYSGDAVTITAVGSDPDGTAIALGQINYGNGQTSGQLTPSNNAVSVTYSGYSVASGSAQYDITARFQSNGVWGEYGCSKRITVLAKQSGNICPVITSTPITSVKVGSTYSYTLRYVDDGTNVVLKALAKPGWLSWNAASGVLSGSPSAQNVGTHSVVLAVDDGDPACNTTQPFSIRVWDDTDDDPTDDGDDGDIGGTGVQAPLVIVTNPGQGSKFFCGGSTISWTVEDDGQIEKIWIEYSTDAESWTEIVSELAGTETSYDWDVCDLPLGTYYVRVWARDNDGNQRAGLSYPFEIVSAGDIASSPKIINPMPAPDSTISETKPEISADFVSVGSPISTEGVVVKVDDKDVTAYAVVTEVGFDYVPLEDMALGEHTVFVSVEDEEGRSVEREWKFTIAESGACMVSLLGLTLPCWVLYALIICGALLLLLIIIVSIVRLVGLAKENREEEQQIREDEKPEGPPMPEDKPTVVI